MKRGKGRAAKAALKSGPSKSDTTTTTFNSQHELLIVHVDVDQGESTLIIERVDEVPVWCAIIDGGFSTAGRGSLIRYLRRFNAGIVDLMVCTHFDGDHTKGLTDLLENHAVDSEADIDLKEGFVRVKKLLVRNVDPAESKSDTKLKLLNTKSRLKLMKISQAAFGSVGMPDRALCKMKCIHANTASDRDENRGSLAFRIDFGTFSYYTAGDLPTDLEDTLPIGEVDAFKAGHHGSANSTSPALLGKIKPRAAFVSCGRNSFGHPTFDVVERLCHTTSTVEAFYLTNCIHNRRGINPKFAEKEPAIIEEYLKLDPGLRKATILTGGLYDAQAIGKMVEKGPPASMLEAERKKRQRILKAMQRAASHIANTGFQQDPSGEDLILGHVGGSATALGSVVLRVLYTAGPVTPKKKKKPDPKGKGPADPAPSTSAAASPAPRAVFQVGLFEDKAFTWYEHQGGSVLKLAEGTLPGIANAMQLLSEKVAQVEQKKIRRAKKTGRKKASTPQATTSSSGLSTPVRASSSRVVMSPVPSSPAKASVHMDERFSKYARFNQPTVAGLRVREEGEPEIQFCAMCDFEFEDEKVEWEFIDVSLTGEEHLPSVSLHRLCCCEVFVKKLKLTGENDEALTEADVYDGDEIIIEGYETTAFVNWTAHLRGEFAKFWNPRDVADVATVTKAIEQMNVQWRADEEQEREEDGTYSP